MKITTYHSDVVHVIRFASVLWIGYLFALAIINQVLWARGQLRDDIYYYILNGSVALLCLGLSYWTWMQKRLGRSFMPVIITIITVLPILSTWLIIRLFPPAPMLDPRSSILMLLPFLLVAFLLVAWQYGWLQMLLVILGINALNLILIMSFPRPGPEPFFGAINTALIQTIAFLVVGFSISYLINRLRKQQQSLESTNASLTHYASTLDQLATSRERNRLARELHDTLAHTLSGLSVQLAAIKAYWDIDPGTAHSLLDKSISSIHSGLEETRLALKALRASPLNDLGLALAIITMAQDLVARTKLKLELDISNKLPALDTDSEQCFYRIAQESITNAVNHANAKTLKVNLDSSEGRLLLTVIDDGIGFDMEKNDESSHFGLLGMRERAQMIGAAFKVVSKPGCGTTIELTL